MAASAFEFSVGEPQQITKGKGFSYWSYRIHAKTVLEQFPCKEMTTDRRYSDFAFLRQHLCEQYPWCIVPPIPEKALQGALDKFVSAATSPALLQYRQRALRKFLVRVGAHPTLYCDKMFQQFLELDELEWNRTKDQQKPAQSSGGIFSAVAGLGSAAAKQWTPQPTSGGMGQGYTKALQEGSVPPAVWEETRGYVQQLETSLGMLRERLELLVRRRKETSTSLQEFGRAFARVGEIEALMEPSSLSNALVAVGRHSEALSAVYVEHADCELKQVVETLLYYTGLCQAVKETLKRVQGAVAHRDNMVTQLAEATNNREKLVSKGAAPDKKQKADAEVQSYTQKRDQAVEAVAQLEMGFKEELRRFHREKQYDIKNMLKAFVDLQLDYASRMKSSWEQLLPSVEQKTQRT